MDRAWFEGIPYLSTLGYLLVFLGSFLETLPGIGTLVPGQTVVVIAGFLAREGVLHVTPLFVLAALGAILGDWLGYSIGRRYGTRLFHKSQGLITDVKELLREHPVKTLILGRFNSITRAFAPFTAGATRVPLRRFMPANIAGGVLWSAFWLGVGYLFGASLDLVSARIDVVFITIILLAGAAFLGYRYVKRRYGMSDIAYMFLVVNVSSLAFFLALILGLQSPFVLALDAATNTVLQALAIAPATAFFLTMTSLLQPVVATVLSALVLLALILRRESRSATLFLIAIFGALVLDTTMKYLVARPRPPDPLWMTPSMLQGLGSYGFPSGHALISVVFFGALFLTFRRFVPWKRALAWLCTAFPLLIGFSRLYIGVHWLSDVLGGFALGLFWLSLVFLANEALLAYARGKREAKRTRSIGRRTRKR